MLVCILYIYYVHIYIYTYIHVFVCPDMEGILPICNLNEIMINNGIQGSHSWDKPIYCHSKGSRSFLVLWGPWWMDVKGCWFWQITVTQWSSLHYVWLNWLNIINLKCSVIYILNSVVTVKSSDKWFSSAGIPTILGWWLITGRMILVLSNKMAMSQNPGT